MVRSGTLAFGKWQGKFTSTSWCKVSSTARPVLEFQQENCLGQAEKSTGLGWSGN